MVLEDATHSGLDERVLGTDKESVEDNRSIGVAGTPQGSPRKGYIGDTVDHDD
jgi:hypothetical protein